MKSRTPRQKTSTWIAPGLGALGGFLYATIDEQLLQAWFGVTTPQSIVIAHDFVDFVLPVFFGILVGFAVNTIQKQARTNYNLSIRNEKLQKDLLVNTLTSLFLHEIRNPLHNIAAALDDDRIQLPKETEVILKRNLTRLDQSTLQYRKWSSLFNKIHPKEKTELRSWLSEFIENKVRSQLIELEIKYSLAIPPIEVYMHPLLLGQCFETLFSNACEAISQSHADNKQITITTHQKITGHAAIEIRFENTGKLFSEELLLNQAHSPVKSTTGLGIGLSLMRKILELADADIALANASGKARVSLFIPGIVK